MASFRKRWVATALDSMVEGTGAVFEAKFLQPWSFSEEGAAREPHGPAAVRHVSRRSQDGDTVDHISGGKWVEMTIPADPLHQHLLLTAEKKFWRCVESDEIPHLFGGETKTTDRSGPDGALDVIQFLGGILTQTEAGHAGPAAGRTGRVGP
jgi:hypothetical protein